MKPVDSPAPASPGQAKLHLTQPLAPKRRCKTDLQVAEPIRKEPGIIYLPAPAPHRPPRMTRSGQPFQVWKAPESHPHRPAPAKPDPAHGLREILRAYSKTLAFLFSWRGLHHSP